MKSRNPNHMARVERGIYTAYFAIGPEYAREYHESLKAINPNVLPLDEIISKWGNIFKYQKKTHSFHAPKHREKSVNRLHKTHTYKPREAVSVYP